MSKAFDDCVKRGGKIRTLSLPGNKYARTCEIDDKVYRGEVKKKKKK
jgi:hypothetical protein